MTAQERLTIVPVTREHVRSFVRAHHRTHPLDSPNAVFRVGVANEAGDLVGVAEVGWPKARGWSEGTLEVSRTATDGTANANSALYGAAWRAARALGWSRLVTYTQEGETGASLRGAGWRVLGERRARTGAGWQSRPGRARPADGVVRTAWEMTA